MNGYLYKRVFLCLIVLSSFGCGSLMLAAYDQKAYENATSLKVETTNLLNDVGITCNIDKLKKAALLVKLEKAYEYANGVSYNNEAAKNWRDQIDTLFPSIYKVCAEAGSVSSAAFDLFVQQVKQGFDTIICLEANKREITRCANLTGKKE